MGMLKVNGIKSLCIVLLVLTCALSGFYEFAHANNVVDNGAVKVVIDGRQLYFDVPPAIVEGRTLVPLRAIFEALGANIQWDAEINTITGTKNNTNIILRVNSKEALVNGIKIELGAPATVIEGRTLVPARFIAESLGAKVIWDENANAVRIDTISAIGKSGHMPSSLIYKSSIEPGYIVCTSRNIDMFLIAAGLHTNFKNQYILPYADERGLYKNAKEYFSPYKDHAFIKDFGKYVNGIDVNSSYMAFLLHYSDLPELNKVYDNPLKYLSNEKEAAELLSSLKSFYIDTNAETFFDNNAASYDALTSYIVENIGKSSIFALINEIENYTGNKRKYFEGKNVIYCTVLSFYRTNGSFATLESGSNTTLASMQFPYKGSRQTTEFSLDKIIKTSVHEYLHSYINTPVQNNNALINELSQGKDKNEYTSPIYVSKSFPWNRVTDENFVRAVEARIYKKEFGEDRAITDIINPETQAGFKKLRQVYERLEEYEKNRNKYPLIDVFISELIRDMFETKQASIN